MRHRVIPPQLLGLWNRYTYLPMTVCQQNGESLPAKGKGAPRKTEHIMYFSFPVPHSPILQRRCLPTQREGEGPTFAPPPPQPLSWHRSSAGPRLPPPQRTPRPSSSHRRLRLRRPGSPVPRKPGPIPTCRAAGGSAWPSSWAAPSRRCFRCCCCCCWEGGGDAHRPPTMRPGTAAWTPTTQAGPSSSLPWDLPGRTPTCGPAGGGSGRSRSGGGGRKGGAGRTAARIPPHTILMRRTTT